MYTAITKSAINAIQLVEHMESLNWFVNNMLRVVYIVHLRRPLGVHHAVVVDNTKTWIIDSEPSVILNLKANA